MLVKDIKILLKRNKKKKQYGLERYKNLSEDFAEFAEYKKIL